MKLVVAVVHNEDAGALVDALLETEFRATSGTAGRLPDPKTGCVQVLPFVLASRQGGCT
jgi:uncharacterized protein YaaQ